MRLGDPDGASERAIVVLAASVAEAEGRAQALAALGPPGDRVAVGLTWADSDRVAAGPPALVVLDPAEAPGGDLPAAVAGLRRRGPGVRLLAATSGPAEAAGAACLPLGFRAVLALGQGPGALVAALRVVALGGLYLDPGPAGAPGPISLSAREEAVLRLICRGVTRRGMAGALNLSLKAVDTYRARGMAKLGAPDRDALLAHPVACAWRAV